jgi:acetylornithine aminotransferase
MSHILQFIEDSPIDIVQANGCIVTDSSGKTYLDCESGCWATSLGHAHPEINRVLHEQIDQVMHVGTRYPNHLVEEAAQMILDLLSMPEGKCMFLSSGSEAVEFAVQCAKKIAPNPKLLCLSETYLAAYGTSKQRPQDEWITFNWTQCQTCNARHCQECPDLASIPFQQIGAFIFEPGSFSGQVKFPPAALIVQIFTRVYEAGGYVVSNEITTGIGRTGTWFGYQHYGIQPDIVAMGKGLGNGYPVSACAMTRDAADCVLASDMVHAQSHQNDPLGAAVAKRVLECIQSENILQQCNENGVYFMDELKAMQTSYPCMIDVRGKGLFIAIELDSIETADYLHRSLVENGFLTGYKPDQTRLRFFPPLNIQKDQIHSLLHAMEQILQTIPCLKRQETNLSKGSVLWKKN